MNTKLGLAVNGELTKNRNNFYSRGAFVQRNISTTLSLYLNNSITRPNRLLQSQQNDTSTSNVAFWQRIVRLRPLGTAIFLVTLASCSANDTTPTPAERLYIIGQDIEAVEFYRQSGCCAAADGFTQYLFFFHLADQAQGFGGLGLDLENRPTAFRHDPGGGAMNAYEAAMLDPDAVLVIGLTLSENEHPGIDPGALARVAAGEYNAEIDRLAALFEAIPNRVILRIGYEFEGIWNVGYEDATAYREAYRHLALRLRGRIGDRVEFSWHASASPIDDILDGARDPIEDWYPGDDVVDWIGVSWFLSPDESAPDNPTLSPRILLDEMVDFATERNLPVIIAEASPQGYDLLNRTRRGISPLWDHASGTIMAELSDEEIWAAWYAPMFDYVREHDETIRAIAYINQNWDGQSRWGEPYNEGYWGDSRLQMNENIAQRWNFAIETWKAGTLEGEYNANQ